MPPRKPPPVPANVPQHHRNYLEPIGPSTPLINPAQFVKESTKALIQAQQIVKTLEETIRKETKNSKELLDKVEQRCSVADLSTYTTSIHSSSFLASELLKFHDSRMFPAGQGVDEDAANEEEGFEPLVGAAAQLMGLGGMSTDERVVELMAEARTSKLGLIKPPEFAQYLRKTKMPDYNVLSALRNSTLPPQPAPPTPSAYSSLLYTITFQPIPRVTVRSPFAVRTQTMHVLGSTSLWQIRENVLAGGDAVATVLQKGESGNENEEDGEKEEDDEDDEDEVDEEVKRAKRRKRMRWSEKRREVGSVFGIEGELFADEGEGKTKYSDMIVNLINSTSWPAPPTATSSRAPSVPSAPPSRSTSIDPNSAALEDILVGGEEGAAPQAVSSVNRPQWRTGPSMQETAIGSIKLKVGEPYWYMHQGNAEHVWTVDSIRHIHSSDPPSNSPRYPITSFLSRSNAAKCRLCDRDPGSIVTIDDVLTGENPALLCRACFVCLHGEDGDGVKTIPVLVEFA